MWHSKKRREKKTAIRDKKISIVAKSINLKVYLRIFGPIFLSLKKDVLYNFECLELIYLAYIKSLKKYNHGKFDEIIFFRSI